MPFGVNVRAARGFRFVWPISGLEAGRAQMRLPVIEGVIRRRLLVNFRVDPEVMQRQIPGRFTPKLHADHAIAGICLIRLEAIRPRALRVPFGISSENAAHRVAVRWKSDGGETQEGVFIPRRDTGSRLNQLAGGRLCPGEHHHARFTVEESPESVTVAMQSDDGQVTLRVSGRIGGDLPTTSCFSSLAKASDFFEPGSLGYSVTGDPTRLDGVRLQTRGWCVEPLQVDEVHSSYFFDATRFPAGSVEFDCALVMRNVGHEWHAAEDLYL